MADNKITPISLLLKRILGAFLMLMTAICTFSACDEWDTDPSGNFSTPDPNAKYHYPRDCAGGKAEWWWAKEALIDQEPVYMHSEATGDGEKKTMDRYTCHLNFGKDRFTGIGTYLQTIIRSMYTYDEANSNVSISDWSNASMSLPLRSHFTIYADEYMYEGQPKYDTLYAISVTGDKDGANYVLTIEYLYTHFSKL